MPETQSVVIRSAANDEIKALRALDSKKGRVEQNAFLSEGLRHVVEAVRRGWRCAGWCSPKAPGPARCCARR